jgi:hypothetical protein
VPTNGLAHATFRYFVIELWQRTLRRRSQKDGMTWERITRLADDWLPKPHILHPWPQARFECARNVISAHLMSMDYQLMSRTAQPVFDLDQSCRVKEIGARARAHGRLNAADNFYVTDFGRIEDIRRSVFVGRSAEP